MNNLPTEFSLQEIKDFSELDIKDIKIQPKGNDSATDTGNRLIQFELPREGFLYSAESYLTFDVLIGTTGNHHDWCDSIFNNIKIEVGNINIIDEKEAGFWRVLWNNYKYQYNTRLSATATMRGSDASEFDMVNQSRRFYIPLYDYHSDFGISNFFKDLLPLYKMDVLRIKLYLNNNLVEYLEGGATSISITNPIINARYIDSPTLRQEYNKDITRNFISYSHHIDNILNGSTKINSVIPFNNQSITGILVGQRAVSMLNDVDVNGKYGGRFTLSNVSEFAVKIDGKTYPQVKYNAKNGVELIRNLERFFNIKHLSSYISSFDIINYNDFPTYTHYIDTSLHYTFKGIETRFVLAIPFDLKSNFIISKNGLETSGTAQLDIDINAVEDCQVDIFVKFNKFYRISANGSFSIKS